jgi:hypothetical protein
MSCCGRAAARQRCAAHCAPLPCTVALPGQERWRLGAGSAASHGPWRLPVRPSACTRACLPQPLQEAPQEALPLPTPDAVPPLPLPLPQVDSTTRSALSYAAQSPEEVPAAVILQLSDYGALDLHPWSINKHHPTLHNRTQVRAPGS